MTSWGMVMIFPGGKAILVIESDLPRQEKNIEQCHGNSYHHSEVDKILLFLTTSWKTAATNILLHREQTETSTQSPIFYGFAHVWLHEIKNFYCFIFTQINVMA